MWHDFWYAIWFFLPAGAANLTPVLAAHLPLLKQWNKPIDMGKSYHGQRLLGDNKTWRGLLSGTIFAMITFWLQQHLSTQLGSFSDYLETVGYAHLSLWLGVLLGFGALAGDAVKSFFKRQRAVASGHSWFPWDQLDYILGGIACSLLVTRLPLPVYVWVFVIWFITHLAVSYFGYLLHLKKTPI